MKRAAGHMLRLSTLAALVAVVALVWSSVDAEDSHRAAPLTWTEIAPGLQHTLIHAGEHQAFRLQALKLDLARFDMRVIDTRKLDPPAPALTVDEVVARTRAAVSVNANFFDPEGKPLGLIIDRGETIQGLRPVDWGVLFSTGARMGLLHTRQWKDERPADVRAAIQVGPRLVVDGKPTRLKSQTARRAALGIDGDGTHAVVVVTDRGQAEAGELAALFARPESKGGLGCAQALAMDGGPSAQLAVQAQSFKLTISGGWGVPVALAFVAKASADEAAKAPEPHNKKPAAH